MLIPKAKARHKLDSTGKPAHYHTSTPDLDNLQKFILDSCKNIVLVDDRYVASISTRKIYSTIPRTEFTVTEIE